MDGSYKTSNHQGMIQPHKQKVIGSNFSAYWFQGLSLSMLKWVVKKIEVIKNSKSGTMNFQFHKNEANDL